MPSALIHLQTGKYFMPEGDTEFFVGTLAPDCTHGRELKDKLHLRVSKDRDGDLLKLRDSYNLDSQFELGALLHLYTDLMWDRGPQAEYHATFPPDTNEWFLPYRRQISIASAYMFHTYPWAIPLWESMLKIDNSKINTLECFPCYDIKRYLEYGYSWHSRNVVGPSRIYPHDMVDKFCLDTANSFKEWLKI